MTDYKKIEAYARDRVKPEVEKKLGSVLDGAELNGSHAIQMHIGLSDEMLKMRLEEEGLNVATTFYSKEEAEMLVTATLRDEMNQLDIAEWLLNNRNWNKLTLYLPEDTFTEYTGKGYTKYGNFVLFEDIKVVLVKYIAGNGDVNWNIATAYPTNY